MHKDVNPNVNIDLKSRTRYKYSDIFVPRAHVPPLSSNIKIRILTN